MNQFVQDGKVYTSMLECVDLHSFSREKRVGSGGYGRVFFYDDDRVIKFLRTPGTHGQYEMLSKIKNLRLPNFYRIDEVLSNEKYGMKTYGGTISQYYRSEAVDLWEVPSSFVVDHFQNLLYSASVLGKQKIEMHDLCDRNIIVNKDQIVFIDVDQYQERSVDCSKWNLFLLKTCLTEFMLHQFSRHHVPSYSLPVDWDVTLIRELRSLEPFPQCFLEYETFDDFAQKTLQKVRE